MRMLAENGDEHYGLGNPKVIEIVGDAEQRVKMKVISISDTEDGVEVRIELLQKRPGYRSGYTFVFDVVEGIGTRKMADVSSVRVRYLLGVLSSPFRVLGMQY
jgi:hypothetical protein